MADVRRIYRVCQHCGKTGYLVSVTQAGENPPVETQQACPNCNGAKYVLWGWVTDAVFDSDDELEAL